MNVYESFRQVVERHRGKPAIIYLGEVLSYGDLFEAVESLSAGLQILA